MKLFPLLLCLLLCGCGSKNVQPQQTLPPPTQPAVEETEPVRMYAPEHPLEQTYQGALRVYPLTTRKTQGIRSFGNDLLLFSGYGSTTLTRLTGEDLTLSASAQLHFELDSRDPSVQIHENAVSYFDPHRWQTVVLSDALEPVRTHVFTESIQGSAILSADQGTIYYCTADALRAWELESNIHRTVKELSYDEQTMTGLHLDDTVLQCRIRDGNNIRTLFLDEKTGRILATREGDVRLTTLEDRYFAALPQGGAEQLLFGTVSGQTRILYPEDLSAENYLLPQIHAAVTVSETADQHSLLRCYSLDTGTLLSRLSLPSLQTPKSVLCTPEGTVYILVYDPESDCDTLYRWDITAEVFAPETAADRSYTAAYPDAAQSAPEALAQCRDYAAQLSRQFGIQIHVLEEAAAVQPWDYRLEAETNTRILMQELRLLEERLGAYPQAVLEKTASHFTQLHLCLVRQITGTADTGSLSTATGVQFLEGTEAYVVIAAGKYSRQALYHELFHVMETRILNKSSALDQWNDLNPQDFAYTMGSEPVSGFEGWLSGENRAFVDSYSMTYPKEDRARIFENAMLPGRQELFASPILQQKLTALCKGIRQAYGLAKSPEVFLWEQYLQTPLAYAG